MERPSTRALVALSCGGVALALACGEVLARALERRVPIDPGLHVAYPERAYLFGLDPRRPDISSQGLRNRDVVVPKPAGTHRVLLLGDSIVYGEGVAFEHTLARQLERLLPGVECVNAGVPGYSPFNELGWYREVGGSLGADVVVVVFCLNDVADPHLHWCYANALADLARRIPRGALPNPDYHAQHVERSLAQQVAEVEQRGRFPWTVLRRSALFRLCDRAVAAQPPKPTRVVDGRRWRVGITGEDSLSIEVLMDPASPEWAWLRRIYTELRDAVRADGARLVVASVPLAFQLDPGYPFVPQDLLAELCDELGVEYVPSLAALREHPVQDVFLGIHDGIEDIWHLTAKGLGVVAANLAGAVLPR